MKSFNVIYRNPGHWDIYQNNNIIFKIRGKLGHYKVYNEVNKFEDIKLFKTIQASMGYITDLLMFELINEYNDLPENEN